MPEIEFKQGYLPGIIGRVTELHACYYHRHWAFGSYFEAKVATEMAEFVGRYTPDTDLLLSVVNAGRIQGAIAIDGKGEKAHLRWFIVSDRLRGTGAGSILLDRAMAFCRKTGFSGVYLTTFEGLDAARHLYERAGFGLVGETLGTVWGRSVNQQTFEALLA